MDKELRDNLGLPQANIPAFGTSKFSLGASKVNSGKNASTTFQKQHAGDEAKRGLGMLNEQKPKPLETTTKDVKKAIGISESTIALIEQLLQSSKTVLEERENISKLGSAPNATSNGGNYMEPRVRYTANDINRNMAKVTEQKEKSQNKAIDDAAKIKSGTEMTARENVIGLTQGATNNNAIAKTMGAQNHARALDAKEQERAQTAQNQ